MIEEPLTAEDQAIATAAVAWIALQGGRGEFMALAQETESNQTIHGQLADTAWFISKYLEQNGAPAEWNTRPVCTTVAQYFLDRAKAEHPNTKPLTEEEFLLRISKIAGEANHQVRVLLSEVDPLKTGQPVYFADAGRQTATWQARADWFAEITGQIYDRIAGRNHDHRSSMYRKIRKFLGYGYCRSRSY